jgi:hypothetical protein
MPTRANTARSVQEKHFMLRTLTHFVNAKLLCACAAAIAVGGATFAASAAPGHSNVIVSGSVHVGHRDRCGPPVYCNPRVVVHAHGANCSCSSCFAKHEYERGFNRGEAFGANAGYRDGLAGNRFCADSRDELCDNSRFYRDGYFAAFGKAYRIAYERGRADRARASHCHHHHHGSVHVSANVWHCR